MSVKDNRIPLYAPDGGSLGFRTHEAARRLLANGAVTASKGRRGEIKALFLRQEDGGNPVEAQPRAGTRYSYRQRLDSGQHNWKHKRLDGTDEDGTFVSTRGAFLQVVRECLR